MNSDVDIGTLPISEWQFSVRHIYIRYRNNRCRCPKSDKADNKIDVDAHLCQYSNSHVSGILSPIQTNYLAIVAHVAIFEIFW
jgi:hypothetical protein